MGVNLGPGTAGMWKKLDQFHLRCLRKICGITWKDRIPNTTVLERCEIQGIEAMLIKGQLWWAGHLTGMEENRIPKALFLRELVGGQRSWGGQHKRYKDVLKYNLKACDIPIETWERQALNCPEWRTACRVGVERFKRCRIEQVKEIRIARHAVQNQSVPNTYYVCLDCQCHCRLRIGLIRKHATPSTNAPERKEICRNNGSDHYMLFGVL